MSKAHSVSTEEQNVFDLQFNITVFDWWRSGSICANKYKMKIEKGTNYHVKNVCILEINVQKKKMLSNNLFDGKRNITLIFRNKIEKSRS